MLPMPRRIGLMDSISADQQLAEDRGFGGAARQGYGLFAAKIWFKSQRCALRCVAPLVPRGRLVQIVRLPLGRQVMGQLLPARHWLYFEAQHGRMRGGDAR